MSTSAPNATHQAVGAVSALPAPAQKPLSPAAQRAIREAKESIARMREQVADMRGHVKTNTLTAEDKATLKDAVTDMREDMASMKASVTAVARGGKPAHVIKPGSVSRSLKAVASNRTSVATAASTTLAPNSTDGSSAAVKADAVLPTSQPCVCVMRQGKKMCHCLQNRRKRTALRLNEHRTEIATKTLAATEAQAEADAEEEEFASIASSEASRFDEVQHAGKLLLSNRS